MSDLQALVRFAHANGYKVSFVGQKQLHDYAGMNPEAAKVMGWPDEKRTFEVDKHQSEAKQTQDLRHELIEFGLMKHGQTYAQAHVTALKLEKQKLTPSEIETLWNLGSYNVVHVHDDADLTVQSRGTDYVVTTEGQLFKQQRKTKGTSFAKRMVRRQAPRRAVMVRR